jgi:hypothetical protein
MSPCLSRHDNSSATVFINPKITASFELILETRISPSRPRFFFKMNRKKLVVKGESKMKIYLQFLLISFVFAINVFAQTSVFTYQGKLTDTSAAANGQYDFIFRLHDADTGGTQIGADAVRDDVQVSGGIFTVTIDFGALAFTENAARFLEIRVRAGTSTGAYTLLTPRQQITSAPFAIRSLNAVSADSLSSSCALCVTDAQIQTIDGNKVTGTVSSANTANNVSGIVPITNGGTGSATKNFADLTTNQTIGGRKTFIDPISGDGSLLTNVPGTLKWQTVSGFAQQMQSNNGYLTTNAAQTSITLPDAPNVGDVVRVSGAGAGGWKIAQNNGQSILVANISGINLSAGVNWTPRDNTRGWRAVASSADGTKLVAVVQGGRIYTSTDAGINWTARESNRVWYGVASSADGNKLVAAAFNGQLYTSTDAGVSWTARESIRQWQSVASSADGTKLLAAVPDGQLYTSADSGATWTARESNRQWNGVVSSADGSRLAAIVFTGQIYTSSDSGVSWTARETGRFWRGIASSADGLKLVAGDDGGRIYTSTNAGASWTTRESDRRWWAFASSADGAKLIALVTNGQIYISNDSGATWTPRESNRFWQAAASSADGSKLVAIVEVGQIYTSAPATIFGTTGFLTGGQFSAIELQYVGSGQFMPLSYVGQISGN